MKKFRQEWKCNGKTGKLHCLPNKELFQMVNCCHNLQKKRKSLTEDCTPFCPFCAKSPAKWLVTATDPDPLNPAQAVPELVLCNSFSSFLVLSFSLLSDLS